jgi:hypothetical protein
MIDKGIADLHRKQMHMEIEHQDREWRMNVRKRDSYSLSPIIAVLAAFVILILASFFLPDPLSVNAHKVSGNPDKMVVE